MGGLTLWYAGLIIGSIFFVLGLVVFVRNRKNRDMVFAKMSLFEIVAAFVLIFPVEYSLDPSLNVLVLLKVVAVTLLDILKIFSANGFNELVIEGHPVLTTVYILILSLVNLSVMISLIGFVFQFLTGFIENSVFRLRRYEKVFLFSEMNEKTISIAKSIRKNEKYTGKRFALVFLDEDASEENREKVQDLRAHFSGGDFTKELGEILKKTKELDLFLFGESEGKNLAKLNEFTKISFPEKMALTRLYVELTEIPWNLYGNFMKENGLPQDRVIVNLVHSDINFVLNDLFGYSVFEGARAYDPSVDADQDSDLSQGKSADFCREENRIIDALIVGSSSRSIEMVKALLPLCQMPGYELKLTVIDEKDCEGVIRLRIPELKNRMREIGESLYTFTCLEHVRFDSDALERAVTEHCPKFTFAFVATGDSVSNINLGVRLNTLRYRLENGSAYHIQACSDHTSLMDNWTPELRKHMELVGGIRSVYNYDFITMSRIEQAAKALHDLRQEEKKKAALEMGKEHSPVTWTDYSNDEYKRHSVYARTLAIKYKIEVIRRQGLSFGVTWDDPNWIIYEHMRWDMYTRTLGYVYSGSTGADPATLSSNEKLLAKVHECLVPFEELTQDKKDNDRIKLTDDIVKIFDE